MVERAGMPADGLTAAMWAAAVRSATAFRPTRCQSFVVGARAELFLRVGRRRGGQRRRQGDGGRRQQAEDQVPEPSVFFLQWMLIGHLLYSIERVLVFRSKTVAATAAVVFAVHHRRVFGAPGFTVNCDAPDAMAGVFRSQQTVVSDCSIPPPPGFIFRRRPAARAAGLRLKARSLRFFRKSCSRCRRASTGPSCPPGGSAKDADCQLRPRAGGRPKGEPAAQIERRAHFLPTVKPKRLLACPSLYQSLAVLAVLCPVAPMRTDSLKLRASPVQIAPPTGSEGEVDRPLDGVVESAAAAGDVVHLAGADQDSIAEHLGQQVEVGADVVAVLQADPG